MGSKEEFVGPRAAPSKGKVSVLQRAIFLDTPHNVTHLGRRIDNWAISIVRKHLCSYRDIEGLIWAPQVSSENGAVLAITGVGSIHDDSCGLTLSNDDWPMHLISRSFVVGWG
jgi:hypothetical protein